MFKTSVIKIQYENYKKKVAGKLIYVSAGNY